MSMMKHTTIYHTTNKVWLNLLLSTLILSVLSVTHLAHAESRYQRDARNQLRQISTQDVYLTVSQYELALIQVLSEICPPMLNQNQKVRFDKVYNKQLRAFMPNNSNPQQALRQLSGQRDYRLILHNVRSWTKSYPASENRALCKEFAQMPL